jgi:hypothetical protein
MSFLKRLFGGGLAGEAVEAPVATETYKGYTIRAKAMRNGSSWQLAGSVEKEIDGEMKVHEFIRADTLPDRDEMATVSLAKGRQLVDEQGDRLFR